MEIEQALIKLSALSQASRLEVFRLLVKAGHDEMSAGEISLATGIQSNTLSFHLKELTHAGLIQARREGRSIMYQLKPNPWNNQFPSIFDAPVDEFLSAST